MRNNHLGCLTGTGIIVTLITVLVIVGVAFAQGNTMFSPGALNAQPGEVLGNVHSHAELGANCAACHSAPWDSTTMADKCTVCHQDIANEMRSVATLHGQIEQKGSVACRDCHPDHHGPTASLVDMKDSRFPHEALGFSLYGHQHKVALEPFVCGDCHPSGIKTFDPATCSDCHRQMDAGFMQAHLLAYGQDCVACHDGVDRFAEGFNHNGFAFKLDGKHANVTCDKCHSSAHALADFATAPQDCFSCHQKQDPHMGQFGTDCGTCHKATGWGDVTFDHNKSNFPLTGAHTKVACEKCHVNGQFKGLNTACVACHAKPAKHAGQFGTDCAACHTTNAWTPAQFNGQHTFPLNHGKAGIVSCATCHPTNYSSYTCYGCHEHNEANISSKHLEEGISNFQDCIKCHPDGRKHEGD